MRGGGADSDNVIKYIFYSSHFEIRGHNDQCHDVKLMSE